VSFQWSQFNNVGKQLLHHQGVTASFEARCRTAIGRAYYSAFGLAHDYLKERGLHVPTNADSHKVVREYFEDASPGVFGRGKDEDCRLIAAHLDVLRLYRNEADDHGDSDDAEDVFTAETCLTLSDEVIEIVTNL